MTILTSFLSAATDSLSFLPDRGSDTAVPCMLYLSTIVNPVVLGTCNCSEMASGDLVTINNVFFQINTELLRLSHSSVYCKV